ILGCLQLLAAAGVLAGNQLARWFAVAGLGLNAIDQMFFIPAYPFWSLTIIAMDIVALWGLCAYGSRPHLQPAQRLAPAPTVRQGGAGHDKPRPARRLGPDGNPLRRRTGKTAAGLAALLAAIFVIGAPPMA